ncbi:hypothetical protein BX661DRAFT_176388, partial [Kickxella alabastrina]|uniref:uncharacterized protein n=1 Tax=Kickxella alabastrina TaxID=61397 RepID=UPI00221F9CCC
SFSLGHKALSVLCFFCCSFWLLMNCWHSKAMYSLSLSSSFSKLSLYLIFNIFSHANLGSAYVSKNTFGRLCKVFNLRFSDKCTSSQENCAAVKVIGEGMLM